MFFCPGLQFLLTSVISLLTRSVSPTDITMTIDFKQQTNPSQVSDHTPFCLFVAFNFFSLLVLSIFSKPHLILGFVLAGYILIIKCTILSASVFCMHLSGFCMFHLIGEHPVQLHRYVNIPFSSS